MQARTRLFLATSAIVTLWQLPYGHQLLYPLTLLATYAHELGHGLTALLLGFEFDQLVLHADGSGQAMWHGQPGRVATAAIAAGGLLGPTVAGISLLLLSRTPRFARALLATLALLMALSMAWWVRNAFGQFFVLAWAASLGLAARFLSGRSAAFLLHLIATTLCLAWFSDLDYLFSAEAVVIGARYPSDSAVIAQALWLPYWFWGGAVALFSLAMTVFGIHWVSRTGVST